MINNFYVYSNSFEFRLKVQKTTKRILQRQNTGSHDIKLKQYSNEN